MVVMPPDARVYVAGHTGLVGSAIVRRLTALGFRNLIARRSADLDLRDQTATSAFFDTERPQFVFLAAAKVGGIAANSTYPADFIYDNLMIATNVIEACRAFGVRKLLNLGSSCIYPRLAPQPLKEEYLLTGPLEETNRAYAIAKIAAIEMCDQYRWQHGCDFISAMPTNLYGPGDRFHPTNSHVLPALIRRIVEARQAAAPSVDVWGTGTPRREFLYVDDLADACVFLMEHFSAAGPINVGIGKDDTIGELARLVAEAVGYRGTIVFDTTKPDGTPRKLLDVSRLTALGWTARTPLRDGLAKAVAWYLQSIGEFAR